MGMERSRSDSISPTLGEPLEVVAVAASAAAEGKNEASALSGLLDSEKKVDKGDEGDADDAEAGVVADMAEVFKLRELLLLFSQTPRRNGAGSLEVGLVHSEDEAARVLFPPRDECKRPGCCCCLNA